MFKFVDDRVVVVCIDSYKICLLQYMKNLQEFCFFGFCIVILGIVLLEYYVLFDYSFKVYNVIV